MNNTENAIDLTHESDDDYTETMYLQERLQDADAEIEGLRDQISRLSSQSNHREVVASATISTLVKDKDALMMENQALHRSIDVHKRDTRASQRTIEELKSNLTQDYQQIEEMRMLYQASQLELFQALENRQERRQRRDTHHESEETSSESLEDAEEAPLLAANTIAEEQDSDY